jgi:hypothetical protein
LRGDFEKRAEEIEVQVPARVCAPRMAASRTAQ